jgi:hypothetical protein
MMHDYAASWGGHYQYATSHGEIDRAFARAAAWLRRPAPYALSSTTRFESQEPGSLRVAGPGRGEGPGVVAGRDVGIGIILDTSGSMLDRIRGVRRIDLAKRVLRDLVTERLPTGAPVALRVLGSDRDVCGTRLAVPLGPLDPARVTDLVDAIRVERATDTPLAAALDAMAGDLGAAEGSRILLVITDSEEVWPHRDLCGADPGAAIERLVASGIEAHLNIVGLAVSDRKARRQLEAWAEAGAGEYFDAKDGPQLGEAVSRALRAPFRVYDADGEQVGSGVVDGEAIALEPGSYRVEVLSEPVIAVHVEIHAGEAAVVTVGEDVAG